MRPCDKESAAAAAPIAKEGRKEGRGSGVTKQAEKAADSPTAAPLARSLSRTYLGGHERERAKKVAFVPSSLISVVDGGGGRSQSDSRARNIGGGTTTEKTFCIKRTNDA